MELIIIIILAIVNFILANSVLVLLHIIRNIRNTDSGLAQKLNKSSGTLQNSIDRNQM